MVLSLSKTYLPLSVAVFAHSLSLEPLNSIQSHPTSNPPYFPVPFSSANGFLLQMNKLSLLQSTMVQLFSVTQLEQLWISILKQWEEINKQLVAFLAIILILLQNKLLLTQNKPTRTSITYLESFILSPREKSRILQHTKVVRFCFDIDESRNKHKSANLPKPSLAHHASDKPRNPFDTAANLP